MGAGGTGRGGRGKKEKITRFNGTGRAFTLARARYSSNSTRQIGTGTEIPMRVGREREREREEQAAQKRQEIDENTIRNSRSDATRSESRRIPKDGHTEEEDSSGNISGNLPRNVAAAARTFHKLHFQIDLFCVSNARAHRGAPECNCSYSFRVEN